MCFSPPTSSASSAGTQSYGDVTNAQQGTIQKNLMPAIASAQQGALQTAQNNQIGAPPVGPQGPQTGVNQPGQMGGGSFGGGSFGGGQMAANAPTPQPGGSPLQPMGHMAGVNPQMLAALMQGGGNQRVPL